MTGSRAKRFYLVFETVGIRIFASTLCVASQPLAQDLLRARNPLGTSARRRILRRHMDNCGNPLGIKKINHVTFVVDDATALRDLFVRSYGMQMLHFGAQNTGLEGFRAFVVGQDEIKILIVEPEGNSSRAFVLREHLQKHGCGVREIAFQVEDNVKATNAAIRSGASRVEPSQSKLLHNEPSIHAFGDTLHTFISCEDVFSATAGFQPTGHLPVSNPAKIHSIDHIVANVGDLSTWVHYYSTIFGFNEHRTFNIRSGNRALVSKVMISQDGSIRMPLNQPASPESQIQEFLDKHGGDGVQHIAFSTSDIIGAVTYLRQHGQAFIDVPEEYFEALPHSAIAGGNPLRKLTLRRLGILVDNSSEGFILQLFTRFLFARPTFFFELIQREHSQSTAFGEANFQALFDAVERSLKRPDEFRR